MEKPLNLPPLTVDHLLRMVVERDVQIEQLKLLIQQLASHVPLPAEPKP